MASNWFSNHTRTKSTSKSTLLSTLFPPFLSSFLLSIIPFVSLPPPFLSLPSFPYSLPFFLLLIFSLSFPFSSYRSFFHSFLSFLKVDYLLAHPDSERMNQKLPFSILSPLSLAVALSACSTCSRRLDSNSKASWSFLLAFFSFFRRFCMVAKK